MRLSCRFSGRQPILVKPLDAMVATSLWPTNQPTLAMYLDFFDESTRETRGPCRGAAMIENHAQFQVTQEQIQRLEQALEQLRQTASTAELMAQAPTVVEHIRRMRAEIDVYLGCRTLTLMHEGEPPKVMVEKTGERPFRSHFPRLPGLSIPSSLAGKVGMGGVSGGEKGPTGVGPKTARPWGIDTPGKIGVA